MENLPFNYQYTNVLNSIGDPSTIHVQDTGLRRFFNKYLMERAMSVYKWKLPESINPYYFNWTLFTWGFIGLFNHDKFGALALKPSFEGYSIYYYPKYMLFTNPAFTDSKLETEKREIDVNGVLLNLKGDFTGVYDLVSFYADQLSVLYESFGVNALQAKNTDIYAAKDKKVAEEIKKATDLILSGSPSVVVTDKLFNPDTNEIMMTQFKSVKDYFGTELLENIREIIRNFDAEIGIPTADFKKERLVSDEVDTKKYEAMTRSEMWLENLQNECKKAKKLLDIDISVDFRYNIIEGGDDRVSKL